MEVGASLRRVSSTFLLVTLLKLVHQRPAGIDATTMSAFRRELSAIPVRAAINRDTRYGAWTNPTQILYRLDSSYTAAEQAVILQAMAQISSDMNSCIKFQAYVAGTNTGTDHIYIGKTLNNGQALPTCFSFPGRVLTQAGQGQKMAIFGSNSANGCMDTTRDVMKYLVHALGLRNEFNRPDRDQFIQVFTANLRPELQSLNIFKLYTAAQVDYLNTAFDFNSVTIPLPTKYAISGRVLYTPIQSGQSFGTLARLSQGDCIGLALQYTGCNFASCQNPYGASTIIGGVATTTGASTTTNTAPTTTNTAPTTTNTAGTTITSTPIPGQGPVEPSNPSNGLGV